MGVKRSINDVFTPRSSEVNNEMYIHRRLEESELIEALEEGMHVLLYGESGNGKSWLYKKVLADKNIPYISVNLANASRLHSITQVIMNECIKDGDAVSTGYTEEKGAEGGIPLIKVGVKHQAQYKVQENEGLLRAYNSFNETFPVKKVIVLDNLEAIFNTPDLMKELADLIILLDDAKYAKFQITFLIVGTKREVIQYFNQTPNTQSVANRLEELPELEGLDKEQVRLLIQKGFVELLEAPLSENDIELMTNHIFQITFGFAQRVQEYCLVLAKIMDTNEWKFKESQFQLANAKWLQKSLSNAKSIVSSHFNSRDTDIKRRNQVIYCISKLGHSEFSSNDIDELIQRYFSQTAKQNMGISQILINLSTGNDVRPALISPTSHKNYIISDPRFLMCIQIMFELNDEELSILKG